MQIKWLMTSYTQPNITSSILGYLKDSNAAAHFVDIEDITWLRMDMNFILECSTLYFIFIFFRHFPKITEHFWRQPKISEGGPMMFRSYSNTSKYFLGNYVTRAMVIILVTTGMAMPISSHAEDKNSISLGAMKIWFFIERKNPGISQLFM